MGGRPWGTGRVALPVARQARWPLHLGPMSAHSCSHSAILWRSPARRTACRTMTALPAAPPEPLAKAASQLSASCFGGVVTRPRESSQTSVRSPRPEPARTKAKPLLAGSGAADWNPVSLDAPDSVRRGERRLGVLGDFGAYTMSRRCLPRRPPPCCRHTLTSPRPGPPPVFRGRDMPRGRAWSRPRRRPTGAAAGCPPSSPSSFEIHRLRAVLLRPPGRPRCPWPRRRYGRNRGNPRHAPAPGSCGRSVRALLPPAGRRT